jgi:hypothetical protein
LSDTLGADGFNVVGGGIVVGVGSGTKLPIFSSRRNQQKREKMI